MDKKLVVETIAMVLLIAAVPVVSAGATGGLVTTWWIGFAALVLGALLPVWSRFMDHSADVPRDAGMEFDDRA